MTGPAYARSAVDHRMGIALDVDNGAYRARIAIQQGTRKGEPYWVYLHTIWSTQPEGETLSRALAWSKAETHILGMLPGLPKAPPKLATPRKGAPLLDFDNRQTTLF